MSYYVDKCISRQRLFAYYLKNLEKLQLKSHNMGDAERTVEMPRTHSYHEPNLRFQSLIGLTPERNVDYFFCM